jgi:glycosyltransferase involved in cell wall biosynthesis
MRVLIVVHQFMPRHYAGTEVVTRDAGLELLRRGHEVHVVTAERAPRRDSSRIMARDYDYRGLKVHAIELPRPTTNVEAIGGDYGAAAVAEHLREHVEQLQPEVIHAYHLAILGASVIDVLAPQRVPLLYTATDFWSVCTRSILAKPSGEMCSGPDEISSNCLECQYAERLVSRNVPAGAARRRAMYRKLASRALAERPGEHPNMRAIRMMLGRNDFVRERINSVDAVLAPTRLMARMLTQNGIRPELVRHSPYGLKLDPFVAARGRRRPSSTVRFGYVGTLRQPKGVEILLEAFKRLPESCDASLRIVGDMGDVPSYVRSLYEGAREDRRINFTGVVPNERTAEQLAEIDVLVVPSTWYENSPTTILLAFAAGVPAIVSDVPGVTEIVRRGDNALLFKMGDAGQLADCMRSVVDDARLLSRLRANAEALRTVEDSVDEALELYDALRATPRANGTPARNGAGGEERVAAAVRTGAPELARKGAGGEERVAAAVRTSAPGGGGASHPPRRRSPLRGFGERMRGREARTRPAHTTGELGRPPFLVTGRARSGTSWVMRILDAHPEILCGGEGRFYGARYRVGDSTVRSLHGALLASKPLRDWAESSGWTRGRDFRQEIGEMTAIFADHVLARELARSGKRMVGDKTPLTTATMLREVAKLRPGTKVAHIIRDGRDVAVSSAHHLWNTDVRDGGFHRLNPEQIQLRQEYREDPEGFLASGRSIFADGLLAGTARDWARLVQGAMRDGRRELGSDYLELRYERLLENGPEEVARLLEFLGADGRAGTASRCLERASFERSSGGRPAGEEDSSSQVRLGRAGDWRRVFTREDKREFKEAAGDLLMELGYERNGDW